MNSENPWEKLSEWKPAPKAPEAEPVGWGDEDLAGFEAKETNEEPAAPEREAPVVSEDVSAAEFVVDNFKETRPFAEVLHGRQEASGKSKLLERIDGLMKQVASEDFGMDERERNRLQKDLVDLRVSIFKKQKTALSSKDRKHIHDTLDMVESQLKAVPSSISGDKVSRAAGEERYTEPMKSPETGASVPASTETDTSPSEAEPTTPAPAAETAPTVQNPDRYRVVEYGVVGTPSEQNITVGYGGEVWNQEVVRIEDEAIGDRRAEMRRQQEALAREHWNSLTPEQQARHPEDDPDKMYGSADTTSSEPAEQDQVKTELVTPEPASAAPEDTSLPERDGPTSSGVSKEGFENREVLREGFKEWQSSKKAYEAAHATYLKEVAERKQQGGLAGRAMSFVKSLYKEDQRPEELVALESRYKEAEKTYAATIEGVATDKEKLRAKLVDRFVVRRAQENLKREGIALAEQPEAFKTLQALQETFKKHGKKIKMGSYTLQFALATLSGTGVLAAALLVGKRATFGAAGGAAGASLANRFAVQSALNKNERATQSAQAAYEDGSVLGDFSKLSDYEAQYTKDLRAADRAQKNIKWWTLAGGVVGGGLGAGLAGAFSDPSMTQPTEAPSPNRASIVGIGGGPSVENTVEPASGAAPDSWLGAYPPNPHEFPEVQDVAPLAQAKTPDTNIAFAQVEGTAAAGPGVANQGAVEAEPAFAPTPEQAPAPIRRPDLEGSVTIDTGTELKQFFGDGRVESSPRPTPEVPSSGDDPAYAAAVAAYPESTPNEINAPFDGEVVEPQELSDDVDFDGEVAGEVSVRESLAQSSTRLTPGEFNPRLNELGQLEFMPAKNEGVTQGVLRVYEQQPDRFMPALQNEEAFMNRMKEVYATIKADPLLEREVAAKLGCPTDNIDMVLQDEHLDIKPFIDYMNDPSRLILRK